MRKLDILIPMYNETTDIVKPLLDSIAIQQNVDLANDVGVIICCDGGAARLSDEFLNSYPFKIEFYMCEHNGVSATRQACVDHSKAEYVMWCDADDMFYNACGLWILFREMLGDGFDSLVSCFIEESRMPGTKEVAYINHDMDSTFVHGKCHRRQYLIDKNIKWNPALTIHEDSPFNILCQKLSDKVKYCPTPFYLWKWRDDSVCRHDPKYILRTYRNMLDGNTWLIHQLIERGKEKDATFYATSMFYDAYYTFNCKEWLDIENQEYRDATELRFAKYYKDFKYLYDKVPEQDKMQINSGIRQRFFNQGLMFEEILFKDWIKRIDELSNTI